MKTSIYAQQNQFDAQVCKAHGWFGLKTLFIGSQAYFPPKKLPTDP